MILTLELIDLLTSQYMIPTSFILTNSSLLTHISHVKTRNNGKDYFSWCQQKNIGKTNIYPRISIIHILYIL